MYSKILLLFIVVSIHCVAQDTRVFHTGIGIRFGFPHTVLDVTNNVGVGVELQGEVSVGRKVTVPLSVGYIRFPVKRPVHPSVMSTAKR